MGVVHGAVYVHSANFRRIRYAEVVEFFVKLLLVHKVGCFGIAFHRLKLQPVFLLAVLVHIKRLRLQYAVGPGDHG